MQLQATASLHQNQLMVDPLQDKKPTALRIWGVHVNVKIIIKSKAKLLKPCLKQAKQADVCFPHNKSQCGAKFLA